MRCRRLNQHRARPAATGRAAFAGGYWDNALVNAGETIFVFVAGLLPLGYVAYVLGKRRALEARAGGAPIHSQPGQYGWFSVVSMALPALAVALVAAFADLLGLYQTPKPMILVASLLVAAAGLAVGLRAVRPDLRARNALDRLIR